MTSNVQRYMLLDSTKFPKVFIEDFNQGLTPYTYTGNTPISNYFEITQRIQGNTLYQKGPTSAGGVDSRLTRSIPISGIVNKIEFDLVNEFANGVGSYIGFTSADGSFIRFYATLGGTVTFRVELKNAANPATFINSNFNLAANTLYKITATFSGGTVLVEIKDENNAVLNSVSEIFPKKPFDSIVIFSNLTTSVVTAFNYYDNIAVQYE